MKKIVMLFLAIGLVLWSLQPLTAQEEKQEPPAKPPEEIFEKQAPTYNSEGRRDPFKDLLSGRDVEERGKDEGVTSYMIDDIILIGIVKIKSKYIAIIKGPQGFPYKIKVGDKFANGFVLTINDSKVVFRQTRGRGVPLTSPRDITKEINPEER
ncbi:MAG: pilus assembly protein PilP [Candidatus Aminicenantes bacterium]|jgi:Tfp pilus assembly protein PilP|nr:pilus assembly protein PilP [Candidatus Aminicenantes bacterium]